MNRGVSRWLRFRSEVDRFISVVAAVGLSPVAAVIGAAVRATSPGGSMVRLPRVGRAGRPFTMWKFRSMRVGDGAVVTLSGDGRVTPVGRVIRRLRLDEIPQLLSVARGDMAIIGPRPETPSLVDLDDPAWQSVLRACPGIAGPTQVLVHRWEEDLSSIEAYRDQVLPVKLAIDAWYVQQASPWVDLLILVSLAQSLLADRSRTVLHHLVIRQVPEARQIPGIEAAGSDATAIGWVP